VNQAARRIGRSLALVLPVVLVLSGTLAVTQVPWAPSPMDAQSFLTASAERSGTAHDAADDQESTQPPQDMLRDALLAKLWKTDPGSALTGLQEAVERTPSLAEHCADIARELGRAAVHKYGSVRRAQEHARPVCDTAFAAGVADMK
jgi:hypothetical protein